jgi:type I restriction enzyme, S subunit
MSESKKLIPRRRFKGFEGASHWNIIQLGDIADIIGGGTPSTNIKAFWNGNIDWYSPTEIGEQIYLNNSEKKITQLGLEKSSAKILPIGSILYTSRAGIGNTAILAKEGCTNQGFQSIVPDKNKLNSYFIYSRSKELKKYGEINGAGSTFTEISGKQLAKMPITLPNLKEQTQIGEFFKKLDNLISTQQKKLEKAKTLKSAYLTEMFPNEGELKPKRRFIKFNDDWKVFLIKELGDIHTGNTPSTTDKINWSVGKKGHVWVTPTDIKSLLISDSERYLTDIGWEKARRIPENSILITSIASIGKNSINTVPVAFNQQINAIIPYKNNAYFILSSMEKEKKRFSQLAGHTSMAIINKTEFENFTLIIPTEQEQTKIGNFFKLLDNKIALEQKKLDKLKHIKQAYLNEMFV